MTVLEADVYDNQGTSGTNPVLKRSFGLMLEALDDLKEGESIFVPALLLLMLYGES